MKQQVNLYQSMFRTQRQLLGGAAMVRGLAAMLAGLIVITAFTAVQLRRLAVEHEKVVSERAAAERRLLQLERLAPERAKSKRLIEQRARLERRLALSRELLETVSRRTMERSEGFADYFEGLARQGVEGLRLTGLDIGEGGRHLQIAGSAVRPELVPILVQRLAAETTFRGASFRSLTINRSDEAPQQVDFVLQTVPEDDER